MKVQKVNLEIMTKAIVKAKITCFGKLNFCETPINSDPKMYDHDGGVFIEGHEKKQWVYFECPRCNYQTSLVKILNKYQKPLSIIFIALHMEELMKDE